MPTPNNTTPWHTSVSADEAPDYQFSESASPCGFDRSAFTAPHLPGADWETVYSGVCMDLPNQGGVENQPVLMGDTLILSRPAQLAVFMRADDLGDLLITTDTLTEAEVRQRVQDTPVYDLSQPLPAGDIHLQYDLSGERWQEADAGADSWKNLADFLVLPAGTYRIYGTVTNIAFPGGNNINNRKLFRYALAVKQQKEATEYCGGVRRVCNTCGCGNNDDGDADRQAASQTPGWEGDPCPSLVRLNPETGKALYDSPWRWVLALTAEHITITPPTGEALLFSVPDEDSAEAGTTGASAVAANRVQYQDAAFAPTTSRTPAYIMMKDETDLCLTFEVATGTVYSITTPEGRCVTAAERARHVQTQFDAAGNLLSCTSAEGELLCTTAADGTLQLEWHAAPGTARAAAEPYKTESICRNGQDTTHTRSQRGLPAHTLVRRENHGIVTITKGTGAAAIVHRYATAYPVNGLMLRTESVYFAATPGEKAVSTRSVYNYSAAGWQLCAVTEGYETETARTTRYTYDTAGRLTKVQQTGGAYTAYEYDNIGRVREEKSPWGAGLANVTRTTYGDTVFFDHRPATVAEYHQTANGDRVLFRSTAYTYAVTPAVRRTTATVTAGNSSQQQVSIEETFGTAPAYAYAAGKMKFSQAANGVQTFHSYEAAHAHGAVHKHTVITKANNELIAAQSRKIESFIAANDTTIFEQESIWDGSQWLLLDTTAYEYDEQQRVTKTTRGNGRFSTTTWMCCGRLSETDEDGITTTYAYDSARQLTEISREEVYDGETCITPETITEYTRDAAGRVLSTTRRIGPMATTESTDYDVLGRVTKQTDVLGRVTTTAYSEDGLTTTVTTPAGATTVTTRNTDGSVASISGTAQRALVYVYDLNGSNTRTTTKLADGTTIAQSIVNGFGQTTVQAQASTTGFIYTRSEYNDKGQLVKQYQDTGWNTSKTAATLYEYDSFGNLSKQTLALADAPTKDNSPVVEMAYSVEAAEDGVFSVTTQTRYNAAGEPLSAVQKQLLSQLSDTLASKSISTDERGNIATEWSEFTAPSKVTSYSTVPTSEIVAEAVSVDGFTTSQKDYAGITTSATRSYTATGMILVHVDGRGNATTTATDLAGRTISVTDATGAVTTTAYDAAHDLPSVVTDAMGNTACYKYAARGRKIAEWGTALQPVCFGYDEADNLISLKTFRAGTEIISSDPSERMDGDETTWAFDPVTGLELSKTYADNSSVVKTYDRFNRLATETDARGDVKTHSYEIARGLLLGTTYSDGTTARQYVYNHLGQLTQVTDDAGIRSIGYNAYGEQETDTLLADEVTHLITETRDAKGRSTGFTYAKNGTVQHTVTTGYGTDGRISTAGFMHGGSEKLFSYSYLSGSNLLQTLTMPCNMTLTQSYETQRDLLIGMAYRRGNTLVTQRTYSYDTLGRPITRSTTRNGQTVNDSFVHNSRSELASATVNGATYGYDYDNIGNRRMAMEASDYTIYESNALNQYTSILENEEAAFSPLFDADGNQTRIKTETGVWSVQYNAENRPIRFTSEDGLTVIECSYDSLGRRATKKVTVNGSVTLHQLFLYRDYLQIACCDLTRGSHPCLWLITWDPSQPVATRPLAICKDGTWFAYGWDLTKNICEMFGPAGYIRTAYSYSPYGEVSNSGDVEQPIQWSSEFNDKELSLTYYNYRHYNPQNGRWIQKDPAFSNEGALYTYCTNRVSDVVDELGLETVIISGGINTDISKDKIHDKNWKNFITAAHTQIREVLYNNKKECIVWLVEYHTYKTRGHNDVQNAQQYLNEIEQIASESKNVTLLFFRSKNDLQIKLNTDTKGVPRSAQQNNQITQFYFFGHGVIGELVLDADMANGWEKKVSWTKKDVQGEVVLLKSSISPKAYCDSWACNTATKDSKDEKSFSDVWRETYGVYLHGTIGKTDYDPVGSSRLRDFKASLIGEYRKPTLGKQNDNITPSKRN